MGFTPYDPYSLLIGGAYAGGAAYKYIRSRSQRKEDEQMDQDGGIRRSVRRTVFSGRKRYNPNKILKAGIIHFEQQLGLQNATTVTPNDTTFVNRNIVSEFDPGKGGMVAIGKDSKIDITPDYGLTPMHLYDLNYCCGYLRDNVVNFPVIGTSQCDDINARAWVFNNLNTWCRKSQTNTDFRYFIKDPKVPVTDNANLERMYRKNICVDMMLYGCVKTAVEYDVRIIRINDMRMCPDFESNLTNDASTIGNTNLQDFKQYWQNLVHPYTTNPMLKGIEPGPRAPKKWFTTVCRKRVRVGEMTSLESVPAVQIKLFHKINENTNYMWGQKSLDLQAGDVFYDNAAAAPDDAGTAAGYAPVGKPYYTSRYYLLVRATCPRDLCTSNGGVLDKTNVDSVVGQGLTNDWNLNSAGNTLIDYTPTYDLNIRTSFAMLPQYSA